ncbi:MAG: hypothetical protein M1465_03580 [Candidatus Marsarchaeota archaeon]|jgi:hypothetical protein|nr:hypothetical protein [Candidatus Marsarchaeota archaeon]
MDDNKQGNKVKKLVVLTIFIIIIVPLLLFILAYWNTNIFGMHFNIGQACSNNSYTVIKCGQNIRYIGNGRISVEATQNITNQTLYNVEFACIAAGENTTNLRYNSTMTRNGYVVSNNMMREGVPVTINVTCYENVLPISESAISNGGLYFDGTLWVTYTLSPNGQHFYDEVGRITLGIKRVSGI